MSRFRLCLWVIPLAGLMLFIEPSVVMATDTISLPAKSEWLPGKIKRGADGKLYLETPEDKPITKNKTAVGSKQSVPSDVKTIHKTSVTLSWAVPTKKVDGSPLKDLAGYKVYYWTLTDGTRRVIDVKNVATYEMKNLTYGETYSFTVTAYTRDGVESEFSRIVSVTPKRSEFRN